jgi:hypothetical protein
VTRRTLICIGLAAAILLVTATTALAATYVGRAIEDPRVRVSFEKDGQLIKRFTIEQARFFCTDGDRFRANTRVGRMRVREDRRFRGRFTNNDGSVSVLVRGRLLGERARGRFRIVAFFDDVQCNTNRVRWRARRQ